MADRRTALIEQRLRRTAARRTADLARQRQQRRPRVVTRRINGNDRAVAGIADNASARRNGGSRRANEGAGVVTRHRTARKLPNFSRPRAARSSRDRHRGRARRHSRPVMHDHQSHGFGDGSTLRPVLLLRVRLRRQVRLLAAAGKRARRLPRHAASVTRSRAGFFDPCSWRAHAFTANAAPARAASTAARSKGA